MTGTAEKLPERAGWTEPPRRLRAQDVIDNLQHTIESLTTRSSEPYVSVEFTRNAKGETQISTKVSAPGGTDLKALRVLSSDVQRVARETYNASTQSYPTVGGLVRNDADKGAS